MEKHKLDCNWYKDWHDCNCGALYIHAPKDCVIFQESGLRCEFCTTKWYNCARCDALYDDQECTCEGK